jgi:hypothetical protein
MRHFRPPSHLASSRTLRTLQIALEDMTTAPALSRRLADMPTALGHGPDRIAAGAVKADWSEVV